MKAKEFLLYSRLFAFIRGQNAFCWLRINDDDFGTQC